MNTAAVNVLAEAGITGIEAEAALRCVLAELAAPSKAARAAIRGLGLRAADLDPSTHRIVAIVRRLADAGLDAGTADVIFGERCAGAILALTERVERFERLQPGVSGG